MSSQPFKWRHFQAEIILLNVRWYCRYPLSYSNLEEMMLERGLEVDHSTINRWVQSYAPELDRRCRPHLQHNNDSWHVDETYVTTRAFPCACRRRGVARQSQEKVEVSVSSC